MELFLIFLVFFSSISNAVTFATIDHKRVFLSRAQLRHCTLKAHDPETPYTFDAQKMPLATHKHLTRFCAVLDKLEVIKENNLSDDDLLAELLTEKIASLVACGMFAEHFCVKKLERIYTSALVHKLSDKELIYQMRCNCQSYTVFGLIGHTGFAKKLGYALLASFLGRYNELCKCLIPSEIISRKVHAGLYKNKRRQFPELFKPEQESTDLEVDATHNQVAVEDHLIRIYSGQEIERQLYVRDKIKKIIFLGSQNIVLLTLSGKVHIYNLSVGAYLFSLAVDGVHDIALSHDQSVIVARFAKSSPQFFDVRFIVSWLDSDNFLGQMLFFAILASCELPLCLSEEKDHVVALFEFFHRTLQTILVKKNYVSF